jgi:hypothetical protein
MMVMAIFVALTGSAGAYIASLLCRCARRRNKPGEWHYALISALSTGAMAVLFVGQDSLFRPTEWSKGKMVAEWFWFVHSVLFLIAGFIALISAFAVIAYFRRQFFHRLRGRPH